MRISYKITAAVLALGATSAASAAGDNAAISREAAEAMVEQIVHPVNGQIARYTDGVCPVVMGVNEQFAHRLADRIRKVAGEAGAPVAPEGCAGNLMVVFADHPAAFVKSVENDKPSWLASLSRGARNRLESSNDPVLAWHLTRLRNGEGQTSNADVSAAQPVQTMRVRDTSVIKPVTRQTIDGAFVVVSLDAVNGRPIYQIADNIALRALTPVDVPESPTLSTVLTAFAQQPANAPSMMTSADLAFLRAVYAGDGAQTALTERHRVALAMEEGRTG